MTDIAEPKEYPSGAFNNPTLEQQSTLAKVRSMVRADRTLYEKVLPPDPDRRVDRDGTPYFGSPQHFEEFLVRELLRRTAVAGRKGT